MNVAQRHGSGGDPGSEANDPAQWVKAAAAGDTVAWERLVDRFDGLVWAVARSFRLSPTDAADVVQTTWLRLVEHLDRIEQADRISAWLTTTARHECLALLRRQTRQPLASPPATEPIDETAAPLDQAILEGERDTLIWAAFALISERCQRLLRLLVADPPPSYEDVGIAMDMPVGSIGPTRGRCVEQLRRCLAGDGGAATLLGPA